MNSEQALFTIRNWPISMAKPLVHLVCCFICQIAKSICFLAVRMLQFVNMIIEDILVIRTLSKGEIGGNIIFTGGLLLHCIWQLKWWNSGPDICIIGSLSTVPT